MRALHAPSCARTASRNGAIIRGRF